MDNNIQFPQAGQQSGVAKTFMASVFSWMATALGISGVIAYMFGTDASLTQYLINPETGGHTGLGYVTVFAPLVLVFAFSAAFARMSYSTLVGVFLLIALTLGLSLSTVFLVYSMGSIVNIFFATAGMFGVMAFLGYTTKTDLTKMGSLLMMAVAGIVISSVINFFVGSSGFSYLIGVVGVIVFTGLAAYEMQQLKTMSTQVEQGTETTAKLSLLGGLQLYITFINLFISLLRVFGSRD